MIVGYRAATKLQQIRDTTLLIPEDIDKAWRIFAIIFIILVLI